MEKQRKHEFFSALKGQVVRGFSPARSRGKSPAQMLLPRNRRTAAAEAVETAPEQLGQYVSDTHLAHSGSLRSGCEILAPLMEGPHTADGEIVAEESGRRDGFGQWVRSHLSRNPSMASGGNGGGGSFRRSDLRLLLGVMGAPLAPVSASSSEPLPQLSVKSTPIVRESPLLRSGSVNAAIMQS
jgi:hypothetical protein